MKKLHFFICISCNLIVPLTSSKVLSLENTSKKENISLFVWNFAHLIVPLQAELNYWIYDCHTNECRDSAKYEHHCRG